MIPGRPLPRLLVACVALAALPLAGCASMMSDEAASHALVAPGKYMLFTCGDLSRRLTVVQARQKELEGLMAKASQGPGGEFVNAIAYRTEYLQTRGEQSEIAKTAADKKCADQSTRSSDRSVF